MSLTFVVEDHYGNHLKVLREYATLWKRTDGKIGGEFRSEEDARAIHEDERLGPKDGGFFATEHLVLRSVE